MKQHLFLSIFFFLSAITIADSPQNKSFKDNHIHLEDQQLANLFSQDAANLITTTTQDIDSLTETEQRRTPINIKEWTVAIYIAAVNDLAPYARKNLNQIAATGSNERVNLVAQLDTVVGAHTKITKRYYVEKEKLIVMNQNDPSTQQMDSGSPETLVNFCGWVMRTYPARHYMLILWNHGTGVLDVGRPRSIGTVQPFFFNSQTQLLELDRTIPYLDLVQALQMSGPRAICFDDITGHYISNQGLEWALQQITSKFMANRKFDIIAFDACLMSMLEVANAIKDHAHYMVSSQEVVLGPGYDYRRMLNEIVQQSLTPEQFAKKIVSTFEQTYNPITNDYTQSAIALASLTELEKNINAVGTLLYDCLVHQYATSVKDAVKSSRHKLLCTHFDEPSYLDLHHLYTNLLANIKLFRFTDNQRGRLLVGSLRKYLQDGLTLISKTVIANAVGRNLAQAKGISIYFPERTMHSSYPKTKFATTNNWYKFIARYLIS